jgi:hypothetical protein
MLKFLLPAGSRWDPDSGILAGNFCRKLLAAGSINELSAYIQPLVTFFFFFCELSVSEYICLSVIPISKIALRARRP